MGVTVTNDDALLNAIHEGERVELVSREYALDVDPAQGPVWLNLTGAHQFYSCVYLKRPLPLQYWSRLDNLRLIPQGEFAALNLDKAAYATIRNVYFAADLPPQSHLGGTDWNAYQHKGSALETTDANDGDSSYKVTVENCYFEYLDRALALAESRKGTVGWRIFNCESNSCRMFLDGNWIGRSKIYDCHIQLAELGAKVCGHSNHLLRVDFERSGTDILVGENSYYNNILTDARHVENKSPGVEYGNRVRYYKQRNIARHQ